MPSRIAICLFEEHIDTNDPSNILGGQPLKKLATRPINPDIQLFFKESSSNTPEWVNIVKGFSKIDQEDLSTATSGAILILKLKKRIVACCFGSSVANINRDNLVSDFGLAAAYQRINKRNIKTIESYTLSTNPITNNRSSATPTTQNNFNLDNYLENITELSGRFYLKTRSIIVKGKEFYSTPSPLNLTEIIKVCEELIADYGKAIRDETYKRLTATKKVKQKKLIKYLDDELCNKLNQRDQDISLLDFEQSPEIESYTFTNKGDPFNEITINDLYSDLQDGQSFSVPFLKTKRITLYNNDGIELTQWSLYKCIFFSSKINIGSFILYKGNWYEIQRRYLNDLRQFISEYEIEHTDISIPRWDGNMPEAEFNEIAATSLNGQCWDRKLYTSPDYSYGIEFCDILTPKNIIHVKKLASSALSSHLILQTLVSAHLLHFDRGLKTWISKVSRDAFRRNILLNGKMNLRIKILVIQSCY